MGRRQDFRALRSRRQGLRLLRRPALRHRHPALRPPARRHAQGRGAPLLGDARLQGRAPLRLGHPRPARRDGDREEARAQRPRRRARIRHRQLQRSLPVDCAPLHRFVAQDGHPPRPLGRLRQRLQDHGPLVHGVGLVGVQRTVGQGAHLRRLQGHALQLAARNAAQQLRSQHGLPQGPRPGGDRGPAGPRRRKHSASGLDHDAVDLAVQHGAVRGRSHHLRQGPARRGRPGVRGGRGPQRRRARRRRHSGGHLHGRRPRGPGVCTVVGYVCGRQNRRRLSGRGRRLREHRVRHRNRAPSPCIW